MEKQTIFGTPITPIKLLDQLQGESFCISYWNRDKFSDADLQRYIDTAGELLLDNGAFSAFNAGIECSDEYWDAFADWALAIAARHPKVKIIVPDTITGGTDENIRLARRYIPVFQQRAVIVWHLHEPVSYLQHYVGYDIAFGSSGDYWQVGTPKWHARVTQALDALKTNIDDDKRSAWIQVHILRAQAEHHRYDFNSSDSTNLATNHCRYRKEGGDYVRRFADRLINKVAA